MPSEELSREEFLNQLDRFLLKEGIIKIVLKHPGDPGYTEFAGECMFVFNKVPATAEFTLTNGKTFKMRFIE